MATMEAYVAVRAHGLKSRLLKRPDYEALARGEREVYEYKDYSSIAARDPLEVKVEKVHRVYVSRISLLAESAPELSEYLWALADKLEFENLKLQLRRVLGGGGRPILYPYGRHVGPVRLSEATEEKELWELALSSGLLERVPKREWGSLAEREAFVDFAYVKHLASAVQRVPASGESRRALLEAAAELCSLVAASWSRHLSPEAVASVARAAGLEVKRPPRGGSPEERLLRLARRLELRYPASLPYAFAFDVYATAEARNVERVIVGRSLGMGSSEILASLLLTSP